jgi:hypothetical protein
MERGRRLADEAGANAVIDQPPHRDDLDALAAKPNASFWPPSEFLRLQNGLAAGRT